MPNDTTNIVCLSLDFGGGRVRNSCTWVAKSGSRFSARLSAGGDEEVASEDM